MPEFNVKLEEDLVKTYIEKAIAEALGKNPEALVQAVVREAMSAKRNTYDRKTIFQSAIEEMIRQAAKEQFKLWLDTQKDKIKKALQERLAKEGDGFIAKVTDSIVTGLAESFYVSVHLKIEDQDY